MAVVDNAERSRESRPILPPTKTLIDQRRVVLRRPGAGEQTTRLDQVHLPQVGPLLTAAFAKLVVCQSSDTGACLAKPRTRPIPASPG